MIKQLIVRWSQIKRRLTAGSKTLKHGWFMLGQWLPQPLQRISIGRRGRWQLAGIGVLTLTSYAMGTHTDLPMTKAAEARLSKQPVVAAKHDPAPGIAHTDTLPLGKSLPGTPPPDAQNTTSPPNAILASNVSYPNTYARGQCTWWVAHLRPIPPRWGNAANWYSRARTAGWSVGSVPRVGAIAWTSAGWAGHVAHVEAVNGNTITISEMNYFGPGAFNRRYQFGGSTDLRTVPASWFRGFIY